MRYDPDKHRRRSIRLRGYDYSQSGAYFLTICTHDRECFLGEIFNREMTLSEAGREAKTVWEELPGHYSHVRLSVFVVMPNHMHGIIILDNEVTVGSSIVTGARQAAPLPVWSRGTRMVNIFALISLPFSIVGAALALPCILVRPFPQRVNR
jgi:REP element-mobilizing transposase RayT